MKKVSIIIPCFNSWKTVGHTLASLARQARRDLIEEVLVVDSSNDGKTRELLSGYESGWIKVIDAGKEVMPALGRNIGAARAAAPLLAFIDSDACMAEDWVEKIVSNYEAGRMLGGGSVVLPRSQSWKAIPIAQYFLQFNEYMDVGERRVKPFLPSCNMFCDKELFDKCGGFPDIRASEDVVFFLKAGKEADVWFLPDAKVYHIFRESLVSFLRNQKLLGKYNIVYRRMLMGDRFFYKGIWPALFLPAFLSVKLYRITRRVLASRADLIFKYLLTMPLFMLGLLWWAIGFLEGVAESFTFSNPLAIRSKLFPGPRSRLLKTPQGSGTSLMMRSG